MYYYEKYNIVVLLSTLAIVVILLVVIFRKRISSLIDPLCFHLLWCACVLTLLAGYISKYALDSTSILFILTFTIYLSTLYVFTHPYRRIRKITIEQSHIKIERMYFLCLLLVMVSRYEFILYALEVGSPVEWFLYRFKQVEGRNPVQYVLQLGAKPFFLYYTFVLITTRHKLKKAAIILLIVNILMDIMAGGRSSLISVIMAFGYYAYRFPELINYNQLRRINFIGFLGVFLALSVVALVTSFYSQDGSLEDGYLAMFNRLLAAGDGLDMYLLNNGQKYIPSGIDEYVKSVFGIFIKRVSNIQTQSVGWQLYELDQGMIVPFSVGPNFILPLQVAVIGQIWLPFYCLFIGIIVALLRNNFLLSRIKITPVFSFVLGTLAFEPVLDMELCVLYITGVFFIYYFIIFPFLHLRIIWGFPRIVLTLNR